MKSLILGAVGLGLLPSVALADFECVFEAECFEGEACAETTYEATVSESILPIDEIRADDGEFTIALGQAMISDVSGDVRLLRLGRREDGSTFAGATDGDTRLLTIGTGGTARYSLHFPDFSITYTGTCTAQ